MDQIRISDVTMKQTGKEFSLSFKEKLEIPKLLDRLNVDVIELEGITPVYKVSNGAGDANIFSGHGFNCTNITTGMFAVHTTDEYLDMDVFAQAFNVVWRIITDNLN